MSGCPGVWRGATSLPRTQSKGVQERELSLQTCRIQISGLTALPPKHFFLEKVQNNNCIQDSVPPMSLFAHFSSLPASSFINVHPEKQHLPQYLVLYSLPAVSTPLTPSCQQLFSLPGPAFVLFSGPCSFPLHLGMRVGG